MAPSKDLGRFMPARCTRVMILRTRDLWICSILSLALMIYHLCVQMLSNSISDPKVALLIQIMHENRHPSIRFAPPLFNLPCLSVRSEPGLSDVWPLNLSFHIQYQGFLYIIDMRQTGIALEDTRLLRWRTFREAKVYSEVVSPESD